MGRCLHRPIHLYETKKDRAFWETLKKKGESTYTLINKHGISSATIDRIRKGNGISTMKIDDLCKILHCRVEDIIEFVEEE